MWNSGSAFSGVPRQQQQQQQQAGTTSPGPPPFTWMSDHASGLVPSDPPRREASSLFGSSEPSKRPAPPAQPTPYGPTSRNANLHQRAPAQANAPGGASSFGVSTGSGLGLGAGAGVPAVPPAGTSVPSDGAVGVGKKLYSAEDSGSAWKHIKKVIGDDGKTSQDLYNLLAASPLESSYSFQQPGWPAQMRSLTPVMNEFPQLVMDRHNSCNMVCFCGAFPSIRRAWASVDNSLFLWRYDRRNDVPIEYSGEEAAICAVGLVKPQPGVFVEAIQHVLVLCTTVEIVLLGVCCSKGPGGSGDDWQELTLQPLPLYTIPSDNVVMTCVSSTRSGRIFLGGSDGHLYEILYSSNDGWRQRRCSKVCLSSSIGHLLPSLVQSLFLSKLTAIMEIAIDEDRHILYTRSQGSSSTSPCIQVWDLGNTGRDTARWVAKCSDIVSEACHNARGGREVFGRTGTVKPGLAYICPIPPHDSKRLHLVAVLNDGRRVFFSTNDFEKLRPAFLKARFVRTPVPQPNSAVAGRVNPAQMHRLDASSTRGLQVTTALYSHGTLLLSEAAADGRATKLLAVCRDMAMPTLGPLMGHYAITHANATLRESVVELEDCHIPGETMALVAAPSTSSWGVNNLVDHLSTQHLSPPKRYVLVSTTGVLELEQRRPVDILQSMLEERASERVEQFFKVFGAGESAAMCLMLIIAPIAAVPTTVAQAAQQVFESQHFTGEPGMVENGPTLVSQDTANSIFNMGRAVLEPQFKSSGAHEGLCLLVARIVRPLWEQRVLVPVQGGGFMRCAYSASHLLELEEKLRSLERYLGSYLSRRPSRNLNRTKRSSAHNLWSSSSGQQVSEPWDNFFMGEQGDAGDAVDNSAKRQRLEDAVTMEERSVRSVRSCVGRTAQALHLLGILLSHHVGRLVARLPDAIKTQVSSMDLRELVCSARGEEVASHLISVLVTEHLSVTGSGLADDLAKQLGSGCPSYFKEEDRVFYQASGLLQKAEGAEASEAKSLTQEALAMMLRVPASCSLGQVVPQLSQLGCYQGVVDLPIKAAAALDPANTAARPTAEGDAARAAREACYSHTLSVLRFLVSGGNESDKGENRMSKQQRDANKKQLLKAATCATDTLFHEALFKEMVTLGMDSELLQMDGAAGSHLETFLIKAGSLNSATAGMQLPALSAPQISYLNLLAKLYTSKSNFSSAAQVYGALATRRSGPGDKAVTLEQRYSAFEAAVLQAKSHGDTDLIDDLEAKLAIMGFQKRVAEVLESQQPRSAQVQLQLVDLRAEPKTISQLFNDFARPAEMWDLCLEIVGFSTHNLDSSEIVINLWDWFLLQGVQQAQERGWTAVLEESCNRVERLGVKFYTNEQAFPFEHVTLRLHQIAAGTWPEDLAGSHEHQVLITGPQRVATAVVQAARSSTDKVKRTYDALLRRREGEPHGRELQRSEMRLQMMQAMLEVATNAKEALREHYEAGDLSARLSWSRESREAGNLSDVCERYSSQALRLQGLPAGKAEAVATAFKDLRQELEGFITRYRYGS